MKKPTIVTSISIVSLLIVLLFFVFLFSNKTPPNQVFNFETKEKCNELAQTYLNHEKQVDSPDTILDEQYTYNSSQNTCLLYFQVSEQGVGMTYNIIDLLRNKTIYTYVSYENQNQQKWWNDNCKVSNGCFTNQADFQAKFSELFK